VTDLFFMECAYQQALKAYRIDEVPIGAILVDASGAIIARGYNQVEIKGTQLAHAEMQVLAKSVKKMNNWRLSELTLYVTVQPCLMCLGALYLSRVSRVVYGIPSPKFGITLHQLAPGMSIYQNLNMKIECLNYQKSKDLMQLFFQEKRNLEYDE
jgi:tRNA(adenine34) deaminase